MIHANQIVDAINFERPPSFESKKDVRKYINSLRSALTMETYDAAYEDGLMMIKEDYIIYFYSKEFIKMARIKLGPIRHPKKYVKPSKLNALKQQKAFVIKKTHGTRKSSKNKKKNPSSSGIYDSAILVAKPINTWSKY